MEADAEARIRTMLSEARPLGGRKILVVGAGTRESADPDAPLGNGRAIALLAAERGAHVACADISEPAANVTASLITEAGGSAIALVGDVADPETCVRLISETTEQLGGLDGLVTNVGIAAGRDLGSTTNDLARRPRGRMTCRETALRDQSGAGPHSPGRASSALHRRTVQYFARVHFEQ